MSPAEQRDGKAGPSSVIAFDLPAQPLASALETYGAVSGLQVVYDGDLARGRQSAEVKGAFTPEVALKKLLAGTGLSPRYMATDGFVLVLDQSANKFEQNTAALPLVTRYYGRVQAALRQSLCGDKRTGSGGYRAAVGFWVGTSGAVTHASLLDTTGDAELDAALDRAVHDLNIGEPPPAGFAQPIVMVITPDAMKDCSRQSATQQTRAGP